MRSDAFLVLGFAALVAGVWQWWAPAAWIVGGVLLMAAGVLDGMRTAARKNPDQGDGT